jgi:glycerol-3-phosphate dehydrogenase (NAD(P)+)
VVLWARREEAFRSLLTTRVNQTYLPGIELPASVRVVCQLEDLRGCSPILVAVPAQGFREVFRACVRALDPGDSPVFVSATKGIELATYQRMTEVGGEELAQAGRFGELAVFSGPTFAVELAQGMPSAAVVAARDTTLAAALARDLSSPTLRLYTSSDVVGVELAGAAKNVIAIAAGVLAGLGLGHNTLAALITRGLHEMMRLVLAWGGEPDTLRGLAGLGDLVLTCTGGLSRNRRTGILLAQGKPLEEILAATQEVAEGVGSSRAILELARRRGVEMPIIEQMVAVMFQGKTPQQAMFDLMTRDLKREADL